MSIQRTPEEIILQDGPLTLEELKKEDDLFLNQYGWEMASFLKEHGEEEFLAKREQFRRFYLAELAGKHATLM